MADDEEVIEDVADLDAIDDLDEEPADLEADLDDELDPDLDDEVVLLEDDDEVLVDVDEEEEDEAVPPVKANRIAAAEEEEDDEEEEAPEPEERGDGTGRIQPKRPGEFVCQSCFLVKHPSQLADAKRKLCADCV
jgi:hypothetical protein